MSKCYLYRIARGRGDHLLASYGQIEEFENALPNLIGPIEALRKYERFTHKVGVELINVTRDVGGRTRTSHYRLDKAP